MSDGPHRRRFLECMGWAGGGLVWSVGGGLASSALLTAPAGRGMIILTSLAIDEQLSAANPLAARLMINLLSAGLRPQ